MKLSVFSLDGLAVLAVFLQVSELYRPLGYIAGFPNSLSVNLVFLAFFSVYLVVRINTFNGRRSGILIWWFNGLVTVPLLIMGLQLFEGSVTLSRAVYWGAFSLLFALLLLVATVLWARWGARLTTPFFLAAIGAAWAGFAVNWIDYQFLRDVMAHGSNPIWISETTARVIGFYQHPNAAAFSLVLYLACLVCDRRFLTGSFLVQAVASIGCLVGVLITGSRTSLLLIVLVLAIYMRNLTRYTGGAISDRGVTNRERALMAPLVLLAVLVASILTMQIVAMSRQDLATMIYARIESITNLDSDTSTEQRVSIVGHYIADIAISPFLGRGPDFATDKIKRGAYLNVSQNSWLEWAVAWGVPYAIMIGAVLLLTYRFARVQARSQRLLLSQARLILTIFVLVTFSMVNPFWMRSPVCAIGVLLGLLLNAGWVAVRNSTARNAALPTGAESQC